MFRAPIAKSRFIRFDTAQPIRHVSVNALLDVVRPDTRIVFVANPGNPTGTRNPRRELICLREGLSGNIMLVIDEAYGEFADHLGESMFNFVGRSDTVVLRTFSKAYGLAGLRFGWGLFPEEITRELRKVMTPNSIFVTGLMAATAALADQDCMVETCLQTAALRDGLRKRLLYAGYDVPQSFANFLLIRLASPKAARRVDEALRTEGVFLHPQRGVGLSYSLRFTIGGANDLDIAADLLGCLAKGEKT